MKASILERVLTPNLVRPKMQTLGDFAPPLVARVPSDERSHPWVSTTSRGVPVNTFLKDGAVSQVFFPCTLEDEDLYLATLFQALWALSVKNEWKNRVSTVSQAVAKMTATGMQPHHLVIPYCDLGIEMTSQEVDIVTLAKGCVAEIDGVRALSAREALPSKHAFLFAQRSVVGHYTRASDFLALTICSADRSVFLIRSDVD